MSSASMEIGNVDIQVDDEDLPTEKSKRTVSLQTYMSSLPLQNTDLSEHGAEDMTKLNYLHEASILDNLRRYAITFFSFGLFNC